MKTLKYILKSKSSCIVQHGNVDQNIFNNEFIFMPRLLICNIIKNICNSDYAIAQNDKKCSAMTFGQVGIICGL